MESEDLSLEEEGEEGEVKLDEAAGDDLLVAPLPDLLAHLLENTPVPARLLLQRQHLLPACLHPPPLLSHRILVPCLFLPAQLPDLFAQP